MAQPFAVALDLDMEWRDGSAIGDPEAFMVVNPADGEVLWENYQ